MSNLKDSPNILFIRFSLYLIGAAVITGIAMLMLYNFGYQTVMVENGDIEWLEVMWLLISSLFLFLASRKSADYTRLFNVLWLLPLIAVVRELDEILDKTFFHGAWMVPAILIALIVFYRVFKSYNILMPESLHFIQTQQAVFLGLGFFIVVIFAQLCGEQAVLKAIFRDDYQRHIGRFVEEILEFLGYIILVIGSLECYFNSKRKF
jgi:hypothetical protein